MKYFWLISTAIFVLSCAVNNDEVDGPVFCEMDQTHVYDLGTTDPGTDFNETNLVKTTNIVNNDCPNTNNDSFSTFVSRVKRVSNELQIFERQYQSSQHLLEFEVSGTAIIPLRNNTNINGCSIIRIWTGTLNTPGTTVTLNQTITYKGACQSTFYNPETDTTNPGD